MSSASVLDVDLSATIYIITHGGCPDGQASAWIMLNALRKLKSNVDVHVLQGAHGTQVIPEALPVDSVLLFCDVCPVEGDAKNIEHARQVFVLDHHPTTPKDMAPLKEKFGDQIVDLSVTDQNAGECGASLVQKFCAGTFSMDSDLLELFWKLDVFAHKIPEQLEAKLSSFKGWITQKGNRHCTIDLVEALAADMDGCLKEGDVFYEPVRENTRNYLKGAEKLYSEPGLMVFVVDVDALKAEGVINDMPIDPMVYQAEIDKLIEDRTAVAFLTVDRQIRPASGAWNLGLRRAGDLIDMGKVAAHLRDNSENFVSGGGHAFAAGAQSKNPHLSVADLLTDVTAACKASSHLNRLDEEAKEAKSIATPQFGSYVASQCKPENGLHVESSGVCMCNKHFRVSNAELQTAIETDEAKEALRKAPTSVAPSTVPEEVSRVCWRPGQGKFRRQLRRAACFDRCK